MNIEFYNKLETSLPTSTVDIRNKWVSEIIENKIEIKDLSKLLWSGKRVSTRFLWLLSEIGMMNPDILHKELPFLLQLGDEISHFDFKKSFASFWLISGVPLKNESQAIDLLFNWIQSVSTDVTTKSRALLVLFELTKKYPELKNELRICLADQIIKEQNGFTKRAKKIMDQL